MNTLATLVLMALSAPSLQDARSDDGLLTALAAAEEATVLLALDRVDAQTTPAPELVGPLLRISSSTMKEAGTRAQRVLDRIGSRAVPRLLQLAREKDGALAVAALRRLGDVGDAAARNELYPLLDCGRGRVESEACRTIFALADEESDAFMRRRLDALAKTTAAPDAPSKHYDDTLFYLAMRRQEGLYPILLQALERPAYRTNVTAMRLLRQLHADALLPDARRIVRRVSPSVRALLHEFILSHGQPEDRGLGLELLRAHLDAGSRLDESVERLLDATRHWLGIVIPQPSVAEIRFDLVLENRLGAQKKVLGVATSTAHHDNEAYTGITLDHPLADVLQRPLRYEMSSRADGKELRLSFRVAEEKPAPFYFGVGTRHARLWFGRSLVSARSGEVTLDEGGRPVRTTLAGEDGQPIARIDCADWIDTGDGRFVPGSIVVTTGDAVISARYTWRAPGFWHLEEAAYQRRTTGPDGQPGLEAVSSAHTEKLTATPAAKTGD